MIHEDIRIPSKRIIPSNCKHMDGSPPLHECLQQIILLELTAPDLILIPGEDGTAVSQMMQTITTVHKKGKPKKQYHKRQKGREKNKNS